MSDCQFCCQLFTTQGGKVPRNLKCGHTICHDCVDRYSNYGKVACIECKEVTEIKDGVKLPLNQSVIRMIDEPQCVFHPDNWKRRHAKYFCHTCTIVICGECSKSSVHSDHTINPISSSAKSYRARLSTQKVVFEKELRSLKSVNERLGNLKVRISETQETQENRLREALSNVLRFEGIRWNSNIERQLLSLVSNYKENVAEKHWMVANALNSYRNALADLEKMEKFNDVDLVFQETELINLERFKIPHNTWEIPEAGLANFHPVILGGALHLKTMKFVRCRDLDPSKVDSFSDYMRSRPGVFNVGPQQFVVFSHEDIFHVTFEKFKFSMVEPHTRMFSCVRQNHGQVHLYKEDDTWILSRVYDPENMDAYVLPDEGEKFEIGNNEKQALETYWNEIIKLGKLAVKQEQIIYPIN